MTGGLSDVVSLTFPKTRLFVSLTTSCDVVTLEQYGPQVCRLSGRIFGYGKWPSDDVERALGNSMYIP